MHLVLDCLMGTLKYFYLSAFVWESAKDIILILTWNMAHAGILMVIILLWWFWFYLLLPSCWLVFYVFFLYVSQIQLISHVKLIVCMYWSHSRTFRSSTRMFCYVHMLLKLKCAVSFVLYLGLIWRSYVATCSKELRKLCANVWKIQVSIRISMAFIQLQVYFRLPLQHYEVDISGMPLVIR